jgi:hypothetical protein
MVANLDSGFYYFNRWRDQWPDTNLFDSDGNIDWDDVNQGQAGTCYIKASMAAVAEFPDMIRDVFVNTETNDEGIYNVKFYIRGKPWIVTVDDNLLFNTYD